jgi:hypothetical protein
MFVLVATLLLSACGAAPTIRDSKRLDNTAARTERLSFIYRHSEMKTVSSYGTGSAWDGETGYPDFGKFLVSQAPTVFQSYGVRITTSRLVEGKVPIDIKAEMETGETVADHVLLLYANSGQVSANRHATRISFVFNAQLVNIQSKKTVWKASIDTSTWSGRDFIQKNFEKTTYDDKYAKQLLQTVADKMKEDGVI